MFFTGWRKWLNRKSSSSQSSRRAARRKLADRRLELEPLEMRLTPSSRTWDGLAGTDAGWKNGANWLGGVAPVAGDDLIFPTATVQNPVKQLTNTNNLAAGIDFRSITFSGSGYSLGGNSITLGVLGQGGSITDSSGALTNVLGINMTFGGVQGTETFNISPNTLLTVSGQLSGGTGIQIKKSNTGTVAFSGDNSAYSGPITVGAGALQIRNQNALGLNNTTTVSNGAALQLKDIIGTVKESLNLSGTGIQSGGALENVSGNNSLSGTIKLVNSVTIGADTGVMTLSGDIQGPAIYTLTLGGNTTENAGKVVFTTPTSYLGTTVVNHGILNIQDSLALGPVNKANGTSVNSGATLQLQLKNKTVQNQRLTLNGAGIANTGALDNISGNNIWDGNIILQTDSSIGVEQGSTLTIGDVTNKAGLGIISDGSASNALTKEGQGELILPRKNTYSGLTTVDQGILTAQNNFALGGGGFIPSVGARVVARATLQLEVDPITGKSLTINEPLELNGPGVNRNGALFSATGINTWQGVITLATDASVGANAASTMSLGDASTGQGTVTGPAGFSKEGLGTVVLPNADTYLGGTDIDTGVLEIQDAHSLGIVPPGFATPSEAVTTVNNGAALWVAGVRQRDKQGGITVTSPFNLTGTGINNTGALRNLNGTNLLSGDVTLSDNTTIGVDTGPGAPNGSELTMTGDFNESLKSSSITKVGSSRLILSGYNLYTGGTTVAQGELTIASNHALGATTVGTVVNNNAALEIKGGIQVIGQPLQLTGTGINQTGSLVNVSDDNQWTGPVVFTSNVTIGAGLNSRLTMRGNISDGNLSFSLTKAGAGKLTLGGVNTYTGGTLISAGIVNIQNSSALGNSVAGTSVANGASLETQVGVNVNNQKLTVQGQGPSIANALPGGGQWYPIGPAGVVDGSTFWAPKPDVVSGRILGVAADPHDANLIYVAAAGGGVWKTKNGGQTWIPLTDNQATLFANTIAIAPSDPNIIYVGTGNPDPSGDQFYGRGVLKSTDGGATWTLITGNQGQNEFDRQTISRIIVDPEDPNFVYVGTSPLGINGQPNGNSGVWASQDGGQTWTNTTINVIPDSIPDAIQDPFVVITDLLFDPSTLVAPFDKFSRHIWMAIANPGGGPLNGLWDSFDSANTWAENANFPGSTKDGMVRISVSWPNHAFFPVVYGLRIKSDGTLDAIDLSSDDGVTWAATSKKPTPDPFNPFGSGGQGIYDAVIAADPNNPAVVYVAGVSTFESPDAGADWVQIDTGTNGFGPHPDHHGYAFDAHGRFLDGNDGGIWRLDVPTVSTTAFLGRWSDLNSNLQITQQVGLAINPQNPSLAYIGTQDNGTNKFSGAQSTGALGWNQLAAGDGGFVGVDPDKPNVVYHTYPYAAYGDLDGNGLDDFFQRSNNNGKGFVDKTQGIDTVTTGNPDNANFYVPFIVDPGKVTDKSGYHRLLLGTDRIYQSLNGGDLWTMLSMPNQNGWNSAAPVDSLAVAPSNSNVIYASAGGKMFVTFTNGKSVNGQQGWTEVDIPHTGAGIDTVEGIWVDPEDPNSAYAVFNVFTDYGVSGEVWKTVTAGATWTDITGDLGSIVPPGYLSGTIPVWSIQVDTRPNPHVVYIGTDVGVYYTTDFGQGTFQWRVFGTGLPNAQVTTLLLDPLHDYLAAGTYGRGTWELEIDPAQGNAGAMRAVTGSSTWSGNVTLATTGSNGSPVVSVGADFGANLVLSGVIGDSQSGTALTKTGPGKVTLLSPNVYSGPTTVDEGTLNVQDAHALGTNTNVTVNDSGSLEIEGDGLTFTEHLTLNGPGTTLFPDTGREGALNNVSGTNVWSGNITLGSDASIGSNGGGQLTLSGVIDDNNGLGKSQGFSLSKVGLGEIVITNANTYSGNTNINGGDINLQNVQGLGSGKGATFVNNTAALWLQFPINPNNLAQVPLGQPVPVENVVSNESLHLNGTGLFGLGALRNVSGSNEWQGSITLDTNTTIGVDDDGSGLTADAGSPLKLSGVIEDGAFGPAALTKVGPGVLELTSDNSYSGGTEVAQGALNIQAVQALGSTSAGFGTTVDNQAALELQFVDPLAGPPTTITNEALYLNGSGINGGGALRNVSGNNVWNGPIALNTTSAIGVENDPNNLNNPLTLTVTGDISGFETSDLNKVGPGTLIFPTANDYFGQTVIFQGILLISDPNALGAQSGDGTFVIDGATLQIAGGIVVKGKTLQLSGAGDNGIGALENLSGNNTWNGQIILNGDSTINVAQAQDTLTSNNTIIESVGGSVLTKIGPGTLLFTGDVGTDNSYTGTTVVADGTLLLDKTGGAVDIPGDLVVGDGVGAAQSAVVRWLVSNQVNPGLTNATVKSDGLLDLNNFQDTFNNVTTVTGALATTGSGNTGAITVDGTLKMSGGTVSTGGGGQIVMNGNVVATSDDSAVITGNGTFDLNGGTRTFTVTPGPLVNGVPVNPIDLIVNTAIVDPAINNVPQNDGLTKDGTGIMELSSQSHSTYTGLTTVTAGALLVDGSLTGNVSVTSGATLGGVGTVGSITSVGGTVAPGDAPLGISGDLTTTGASLDSASSLSILFNSNNPPGSGYSQLVSNGDVNLNSDGKGGATLTGTLGATFFSAINDTFSIIQVAPGHKIIGTFSNAPTNGSATYVGGMHVQVNYLTDNSGNVVGVQLTHIKADAQVGVVSSTGNSASVYGQPVTFTVTVTPVPPGTGTPSGTVHFVLDNVDVYDPTLVNGQATFTPTVAQLGVSSNLGHSLYVTYDGDALFNGPVSSTTLSQIVTQSPSMFSIVPTANPAAFGQSVSFNISVLGIAPGGTAAGSATPSGNITITLDKSVQTPVALDSTGHYIFSAGPLSLGNHFLSVSYVGDPNYLPTTIKNYKETIVQGGTTTDQVTSVTGPTIFGQQVTFGTAVHIVSPASSALGSPIGTVTFYDNGTAMGPGVPLGVNGTAFFTTPANLPLSTGTHTDIYAVFTVAANSNFAGSDSSGNPASQIVSTAPTSTVLSSSASQGAVFGQPVTISATVTAGLSSLVTPGSSLDTPGGGGTVDFQDTFNNVTTDLGSQPVGSNGVAQLVLANGLAQGTHAFTATYSGDTNFQGSSANGVSGTLTQTVNKANSQINVTFSPTPSVFGQSETATVTVSAVSPGSGTPGGSFTYSVDGSAAIGPVQLGNTGSAMITIGSLAVNQHFISVSYGGDGNFNANTTTPAFSYTVSKAGTTTSNLTASPSILTYGASVTYTATVQVASPGAGTPGGTVDFTSGSFDLGSGSLVNVNGVLTATISTLATPGGLNNITATYSGDSSFQGSSGTTTASGSNLTVNVSKANSMTAKVAATANPATFGVPYTLSTHVTPSGGVGIPTGTVTFLDNGAVQVGKPVKIDQNGNASLPVMNELTVGSHSITAFYSGDGNFNQSLSSPALTLTVNGAATQTSISTSSPSAPFGDNTITASVKSVIAGAGAVIGQVQFTIDGVAIAPQSVDANGQAVLDSTVTSSTGVPLLSAGTTHTVSAAFLANSNFSGSPSGSISQTVTQAFTTLTLIGSNTTSVYGQLVSYTANLAVTSPGGGTPTGSITFKVDGTPELITLNNTGAAVLSGGLGVGKHTITASYVGDPNFVGISAPNSVTTTTSQAQSAIAASLSSNSVGAGQPFTINVAVSAVLPGLGTPTGSLLFFDNSVQFGSMAYTGGPEQFVSSGLPSGNHNLTISYSGDGNFIGTDNTSNPLQLSVARLDATLSLVSSRTVAVDGRSVTFTATVSGTGVNGPTGVVTFYDGSTPLGSVSLVNGQAIFVTSLTGVGTHAIVAQYSGDANYNPIGNPNALEQLVGSANQAFVAQVYLDGLHRQVDVDGLAFWSGKLDAGALRSLVVNGILGSSEFHSVEADEIYVKLLHRHVDPSGFASFTAYLDAGHTVEEAEAQIIGSTEYFINRGNGTNDGFLSALYSDMLNRVIDQSGHDFFILLLQQFTPRTTVASAVIDSVEGLQDRVDAYYVQYQHRHADPSGIGHFTSLLQNGFRDEGIILDILASDEYFAKL